MKVVLHAGVHKTDEGRLLRSLMKNAGQLGANGLRIPPPSLYQKRIRDIIRQVSENGAEAGQQGNLAEVLITEPSDRRIILSNDAFFGTAKMATTGGVIYSTAEARLDIFRQIFSPHEVELFLAIRNPAAFLPAMLKDTSFASVHEMMRGADYTALRWSDLIHRLRQALPGIPVTVWCNEDSPLIWPQIMRRIAAVDVPLAGEHDMLGEIMIAEGFSRFETYMKAHPHLNAAQGLRVMTEFLDKFADEAAIEEVLDAPEWTDGIVELMTARYDADLALISAIEGVQVIQP